MMWMLNNTTSFYGSSCANNDEDAVNTHRSPSPLLTALSSSPLSPTSLPFGPASITRKSDVDVQRRRHHGGNHPISYQPTGRVEISAQNHNYAVDPKTLPEGVEVTHINLNDGTCAGMLWADKKAMTIQYHPEASPGPHDGDCWFFYKLRESLGVRTYNDPFTTRFEPRFTLAITLAITRKSEAGLETCCEGVVAAAAVVPAAAAAASAPVTAQSSLSPEASAIAAAVLSCL
eukprot:1196146-Prorocentrum_minimum.AAC.9